MQQTLQKRGRNRNTDDAWMKYLSGATTWVAKNNLVEAIDAFAQLVATRRSWWRSLFVTHCNSQIATSFSSISLPPQYVYHHSSQPSNSLSQTNANASLQMQLLLFVFLSLFSFSEITFYLLFSLLIINNLFLLFLTRRELQAVVEYV